MIRKAILKSFDSGTYKATVELVGSDRVRVTNISVSRGIGSGEMVAGRKAVISYLDPSNPQDSVVVAIYT